MKYFYKRGAELTHDRDSSFIECDNGEFITYDEFAKTPEGKAYLGKTNKLSDEQKRKMLEFQFSGLPADWRQQEIERQMEIWSFT